MVFIRTQIVVILKCSPPWVSGGSQVEPCDNPHHRLQGTHSKTKAAITIVEVDDADNDDAFDIWDKDEIDTTKTIVEYKPPEDVLEEQGQFLLYLCNLEKGNFGDGWLEQILFNVAMDGWLVSLRTVLVEWYPTHKSTDENRFEQKLFVPPHLCCPLSAVAAAFGTPSRKF